MHAAESRERNPKRSDRSTRYPTSLTEPKAMCKNRLNSASVWRPQPSTIFVGTETAARRI